MPYLPTRLEGAAGVRLDGAVRRAAAVAAARHRTGIGTCGYFPGISDMSFLGQVDAAAVPAIAANTPAWGHGIAWPAGRAALGVPIVNAGPWGRDYHTPLERLHTGYAFARCCRTCCSRSSVASWTIPGAEAGDYWAAISTCLVPEVVMPTCFQALTSLPATPAP